MWVALRLDSESVALLLVFRGRREGSPHAPDGSAQLCPALPGAGAARPGQPSPAGGRTRGRAGPASGDQGEEAHGHGARPALPSEGSRSLSPLRTARESRSPGPGGSPQRCPSSGAEGSEGGRSHARPGPPVPLTAQSTQQALRPPQVRGQPPCPGQALSQSRVAWMTVLHPGLGGPVCLLSPGGPRGLHTGTARRHRRQRGPRLRSWAGERAGSCQAGSAGSAGRRGRLSPGPGQPGFGLAAQRPCCATLGREETMPR